MHILASYGGVLFLSVLSKVPLTTKERSPHTFSLLVSVTQVQVGNNFHVMIAEIYEAALQGSRNGDGDKLRSCE